MWISRDKYDRLVAIEERYNHCQWEEFVSGARMERCFQTEEENKKLREELKELKIKYTDEVKKNFELANILSEMNKT